MSSRGITADLDDLGHRRYRLLAISAATAALFVVALVSGPPWALLAVLGGPALADPGVLVLAAAGTIAWLTCGWLLLLVALGLLARLPGLSGRIAGRVAGRLTPALLRRAITTGLGITLLTGCGADPGSHPTTAPALTDSSRAAVMARGVPSPTIADDVAGQGTAGQRAAGTGVAAAGQRPAGARAGAASLGGAIPGAGQANPAGAHPERAVGGVPGAGAHEAEAGALEAEAGAHEAEAGAHEAGAGAREPGAGAREVGDARLDIDWQVSRPAGTVAHPTSTVTIDWPAGSRQEPPPARPGAGAPATAPAGPAAAPTSEQDVVVRPGDTLWSIAAQRLDTADPVAIDEAWRAWFAANRAVIGDDPDLILPGQVLHPPPADSRTLTEETS